MSQTKVTDNLRDTTQLDGAKITTGTIPEARITALDATKLTGTVADARFPATLPASSGANLTALPAGNLTGSLPSISGASLTNLPLVRKSLIINGAMNIAQRGTSFAALANEGYSLDRWRFEHSSLGVYTVTQDSSGPAGFANSLKIDCTTADASPAAGDYLELRYLLEGQNLQHLKKGTADAESVTLSFWVKCNKTGNFASRLYDNDNTRIIGSTVTISSADTWEYKSITYAGDTTGAFDNDINKSLMVDWIFDAGSTYTSGSVPTSWEASTNADYAAGTTLALGDSTSNYINITGVKLEVGTSASDFEHKSYGEEHKLCQRYCRRYGSGVNGAAATTERFYFSIPFEEAMRVTPTLTLSDTSIGVGNLYSYDKTSSSSAFYLARSSKTGAVGGINGFTGMTQGHQLQVWQALTDDYWLLCDAEL